MAGQDDPYDPLDEFDVYGPTMDEPIPAEDRSGHEPVPEVLGAGWEDWLESGGRAYDPSVDEELEAAGVDPAVLEAGEKVEVDDTDPPASVAGWELAESESDFVMWTGDGGRPPAGFVAADTTASVTALSHGGRWENRWTARVKYEGPDRDGEERSTTSTIASHKLTTSAEDRGFAKNRARAIDSAIDWMEKNPSTGGRGTSNRSDSEGEEIELEFGRRDAANATREWLPADALTDRYDGRHKTVEVYRNELTEAQLNRLTGEAADSKSHEAEKYGQLPLSDSDLRQLKDRRNWGPEKRFHARSAKAIFAGKGVDDWISYYDLSLSVDEHRAVADRSASAGGGKRMDVNEGEAYEDSRLAAAFHNVLSSGCEHARTWCEKGSEDACEYLITDCDWTPEEVDQLAQEVETYEEEMDDLLTDDGGRVEPDGAVDAPAVPETGEIPGFAKGTLKRAWSGYRAAIGNASEHREAAEAFEESRSEAERYAQIVNEVRGRFGQEAMSFDRLGELNEVSPVELSDAPTNEENTTGFEAAVQWSQRTLRGLVWEVPYDPVEELGGPTMAASDLEKAEALHASRSERAQTMDESIQAREQVTEFEEWAEAPNTMDFVGVDDLESVLGYSG